MDITASSLWFEAVFIFLLILVNGFFAGSEIAVVSSRRSRVGQMEKEGRRGARVVSAWLKEPEVFLATVQIVVTLVGALASALGGAAAIEFLKPRLDAIPQLSRWSHALAIALVVLPITYLSLVIGELVPKSLALISRENMAVRVAFPIHWLSKAARPLVWVLAESTRAVLFVLGRKKIPKEMFASEEEIRFMIMEGGTHGIFDQAEQQMIPKVFDFSNLQIKDVMIPRNQIFAVDIGISREDLLSKVPEEGFTRVPVYQGTLDKVAGILHMKDLIYILSLGQAVILQDLIRPAVFVLETTQAQDLLKLFQKQRLHMALVQDENKKIVGLVTLENLIERIVGDIKDEHDAAEEGKGHP
ncbi:MAG: hypothetical protein A3A86_01415 [Elusimicrobia bacterium RIFCSPLOWO2_01_FULL_60_11]|nr:MAG: hypothetical protein A3A86_01415 [Elusimicrobia bacterium RIFCSPLOWO2_01_FULL_60_11]